MQNSKNKFNLNNNVRGYIFDIASTTLFRAMTVMPPMARRVLIDQTILKLKASGAWSDIDVLAVTAAHDSQAALLNWKTPAKIFTAVNSPTFVTDRGYAGNGTTSYLSYADNLTVLPQFLLDDCTFFGWNLTDAQSNAQDLGASSSDFLNFRSTTDAFLFRLNTTTSNSIANASSLGLHSVSRTGSTTSIPYKNGVAGTTGTGVSTAVTASPFLICKANTFSTKQIAAAGAGKSMTAARHLSLYNTLLTYMQAVGASA